MSRILKVMEYDEEGIAVDSFIDPNQQYFSIFEHALRNNRLSWRDDLSIHQRFHQAAGNPEWNPSVCKEQKNIEDHATFW